MPLLNIALVTQALLRLIEAHVTSSPEWNPADPLLVSPLSADKLTGERTIGLYLYHLVEDAQYKNLPASGNGNVPLRFTPMGLDLSYQLTAKSSLPADNAALEEQRLMGLAIKALRDFPVLDDETVVDGTTIFPASLAGRENRLRIVLQAVQPHEATQYWTAGSLPMRLAAYYQVSVILLEPESVTSRAGRVLVYGIHTFVRGAPRLDASQNRIEFLLPGETTSRIIDLRPAEVAVGQAITFVGTELSDDATTLFLKSPRWTEGIEADRIQWGVTATPERVFATVQELVGSEPVLPGPYTAAVKVTTERVMPDGSVRRFEKTSNHTPFTVAPRIDAVSAFVAGLATVTGLNFDPALLPDEAIQVFLGPDRLTRVDAGTPAAGEFRPLSRTTLRFRLPVGLGSGEVVPLRLLVRGAESAPRWIVVP